MQKIPTETLLEELKAIDSRVELVPNPNRPGLSNFKIGGIDICPVPSEELQTEHSPDYCYTFPNGMRGTMKTYDEAKGLVLSIINRLKDTSFQEEFFDITNGGE